MMGTQQEDKSSLSLSFPLWHRSLWSRAEPTLQNAAVWSPRSTVTHTVATSEQQVSVFVASHSRGLNSKG